MKETRSILLCGVGGQGILLASEVISYALIGAGYDVKKSEVHGMAQRGGSVVAHLRYGEKVYSPLIEPGSAGILLSFELMESLRYLPFLTEESRVVVNTQKIYPPSVSRGVEEYHPDIIGELTERGLSVLPVDAFQVAGEVGELRTVNMVLVGAMSGFLDVDEKVFHEVIAERVKKGLVEVNLKAFQRGREVTAGVLGTKP